MLISIIIPLYWDCITNTSAIGIFYNLHGKSGIELKYPCDKVTVTPHNMGRYCDTIAMLL